MGSMDQTGYAEQKRREEEKSIASLLKPAEEKC
jgi:hypothetical protein